MRPEVLLRKILSAADAASGGYVLTIDDGSLEEVPATLSTAHGTWSVRRPTSELDLRHTLWKAQGARVLAILPPKVAQALSVDLVRCAQKGLIIRLEPVEILRAALGIPVQVLDEQTLVLALEYVDELEAALGQRTRPSMLDRRLLDTLLLDVCVGSSLRESRSGGALLAHWLTEPPEWSAAVNQLVHRMLPHLLGTEGRVLSWALESAKDVGPAEPGVRRRLEALLVRGLLFDIDTPDNLPPTVWGELDRARGSQIDLGDDALMGVVATLAVDALDALGSNAGKYLTAAENEARKIIAPILLRKSRNLPLGLEVACDALANRMAQGQAVSSAAIDALAGHRASALAADKIGLLAEMARLSRWLDSPAPDPTDVLGYVQRYQRHGAFADLTATNLRRAGGRTASYRAEAQSVLSRWQTRRNQQNEAFARLLAGGYVKNWHAEGVVPLHRIWQECVLLREAPKGVFVIVMDGCSYPVFVDLVQQLRDLPDLGIGIEMVGAKASGPDGQGELGRAEGIAALAPLPSITSHARGAIFLGELPNDPWMAETVFREEGERKSDPARFKQNHALGSRTRRLFLKGDLADGGAALVQALAGDEEIVATVYNAVDDLISSHATGVLSRLAPEDIAGFLPALRAAFAAGREVLITADHGHTPFLHKDLCVGSGTSARWCELTKGATPPEGFLEIDVEGLGGPKGPKAFAWKLGAYQGKPHVGFHGGAGLEELVVPMAWLQVDGSAPDQPIWWHGSSAGAVEELASSAVPPVTTSKATKVRKPKKTKKPKVLPGQSDLFDSRKTQAALALAPSASLPLAEAVLAELDDGERTTLALLLQNGSANTTDIGKVQQRRASRVNGYMARLKRKLHKLGADCFDVDRLPSGESVYTWTGGKL